MFKAYALALTIILHFVSPTPASAENWHPVFSCGDQIVVDKATGIERGQRYERRQLVLRNQAALNYFRSKNAINPRAVNETGEFIYPVVSSNWDGKRFESTCDPDIHICYVVREIGHSRYRLEAWRTAYSPYGPQGLAADWIFNECTLSPNY